MLEFKIANNYANVSRTTTYINAFIIVHTGSCKCCFFLWRSYDHRRAVKLYQYNQMISNLSSSEGIGPRQKLFSGKLFEKLFGLSQIAKTGLAGLFKRLILLIDTTYYGKISCESGSVLRT